MNFIEDHSEEYDDFDFSEDNCSGQNKSRANPTADMYCIHRGFARSITTRFYEVGYSFMPPDQCGGQINQKLRKQKHKIETSDAAFNLMTRTTPSDFIRHRMKTDEWKDWWKLALDHTRVLGRKYWNEDGGRGAVHFLDIAIWKVSDEPPRKVYFKYSHFDAEPWQYIKVRKGSFTPLMKAEPLQPYSDQIGGVKIKMPKWIDLKSLLQYLKKENHEFYKRIEHDGIPAKPDDNEGSEDERLEFPVNYRLKHELLTAEQL